MDKEPFDRLIDRTYRWTWFGQLKFELAGKLGHLFYHKGPPTKKTEYQLLHLGCGPNYFKEFINADYYFLRWLPWRDKSNYDWLLDFRKPMKCPSNRWDGVFTEHTKEHLHPSECLYLFGELYRTMKAGAIFHFTQNYYHLSVWDFDLFKEVLMRIGFRNVQECTFMRGGDTRLLKDMPDRRLGSLYVEAQK